VSSAAVSVQAQGFSAVAELDDAGISARLIGTADLTVNAALEEFIQQVHGLVQARNATEVVVDFRDLEFMNSSCLKGMVSWICRIQELPRPSQYRMVLVASSTHQWQRRSLPALTCVAADVVTIQS
jgi:hypothetical protein